MTHPLSAEQFTAPTDRIERLLDYPGARPETSFMTDGEMITELPNNFTDFSSVVDEQLKAAGLPLLAERIPVLAYGANANPVRLHDKMQKFGSDQQAVMQTVPHIAATIPDALAVWHGQPGQTGSNFAELFTGSEAEGASLQAHVAFLTLEQLAAIHTSEGVTYSAAEVAATIHDKDESKTIPVMAYVALRSTILLKNGQPVLVAGLRNNNSDLPTMSAEESVDYMLEAIGREQTARQLIADAVDLTLKQKKARQAEIGQLLANNNVSRAITADDLRMNRLIGRADFASLPGSPSPQLYRLPEMALQAIRPSTTELAAKIATLALKNPNDSAIELRKKATETIDPARMVSRRASNELTERTGLKEKEVSNG